VGKSPVRGLNHTIVILLRLLLSRSVWGVTRLVALVFALGILSSTSKTPSPVPVVDKVVEEDRRMLLAN
jgi:hypothetical protein